ncbi:MAG: hypothetical protein A2505_03050 [Deltaproteobacteria bacterium RIFOXYD12_FULL_55_16]|nr:MAG: hypothetical protein A2505_03050 [Deltaproteobacteria bacterium RIFOXYD12_FULL_55_16]
MSKDAFEQFMQHMPLEGDMDLIVLKGHLLVQEGLWSILEKRLKNPKVVEKNDQQFGFFQLMCVGQALVEEDEVQFHEANWLWNSIVKLNELRNKIAHKLDCAGLEDRINYIISLPPEKLDGMNGNTTTINRFSYACFQMCLMLEILATPIDWQLIEYEAD